MSRHRLFLCLLIILTVCSACRKRSEVARGGAASGARLVVRTGGYLPPAPGSLRRWVTGGLAAPGDIDGDGWADLLVGSGAYPGSFAAFSGKDGKEIWRVKAKTSKVAAADGEKGYTFDDFALIGDVNGDGIADIFIRNSWAGKEAFIFSGKDGSRMLRAATGHATTPVRASDLDGDGVAEVVFLYDRRLSLRALSAVDLSAKLNKEDLLGLDPELVSQKWIAPAVADIDGDGVCEFLAGVADEEKCEMVFLSGASFSAIKRIPAPRDVMFGRAVAACPGDLSRDGVPDLVIAHNRGAEVNEDVSYLAAFSGADGSRLWQVAGSSLPGGPPRIAVSAKTGERRSLPGDVGFGDRVTFISDLDGDGALEIACSLPTVVGEKRTRGVLIFSGATGERLATLTLAPKQGRLLGGQMVLLDPYGPEGWPALAVSVVLAKDKYGVAVFDLPGISE